MFKVKPIFSLILLFALINANDKINHNIVKADSLLSIGESKSAAYEYNDIGYYFYKNQNYNEALNYWEKSLKNYNKINDLYGISNLSNRVGVIYKKMGFYSEALKYYNKSYNISKDRLDDKLFLKVTGKSLNNLGTINMVIGDYYRSLTFLNRSLNLKQKEKNKMGEASTLLNLGNVHTLLRNDYKALEYLNKGEILAKTLDSQFLIAKSLSYKASLFGSTMSWDSAKVYYEKSIDHYKEINDKKSLCYSLQDLGRIYLKTNEMKDAYINLNDALALTKKNNFNDNLQIIYSYLGIYHSMANNDSLAIDYLKKSVESIEEYRLNLESQTQQINYLEKRIDSYRRLIKLLIFNKNYKDAFKYMEKLKARTLLDLLEGGGIDFTQVISKNEIVKEKQISNSLEDINKVISNYSEYEDHYLDSLLIIQKDARFQLEEFKLNLYRKYPELVEYRGMGRPLDIRRAKRIVARDEAVVYYFLTDPEIYNEYHIDIFVITKNGLVHREVTGEIVEEADYQMDDFLNKLSKSIPEWDEESSTVLYDALIKPIENDIIGKKRICIIPEGKLNYIPFQALKNNITKKYLIEDYAIYYSPSLSTLHWLRSLGTYGGRDLFAVGDPIFDEIENEENLITMRSELAPLPASRDEVLALENVYESNATVYLSEESTESNFKMMAPDYGIIHIASHGLVDDISPLYSSIAFTKENSEDGFLEVREIFNMVLNADLAILSACKTGTGHNLNGEGLLGLTRAFFTAGVPSVVSSLWNVADVSTRDLMIEFHTYLRDGERPAIALQKAQIHLINNTPYNNPVFWAPFKLSGDSE